MTRRFDVVGGMVRDVRTELPRVGRAGSRSALLHDATAEVPASAASIAGVEAISPANQKIPLSKLHRFYLLRWLGTIGAFLISVAGLGAGALPVVGNPYYDVPFGGLFARMLQAASSLVMIGVGLMVMSWVLMMPLLGVKDHKLPYVNQRQIWVTFLGWVVPLLITAPLFTQDIYSYLANGFIVRSGLDPYSAGPVQLLGADNPLARSVPFIWANSPSPYGPVALGVAAVISWLTGDSILLGVLAHRIISIVGVITAGRALGDIAKRCKVSPEAALWLAVLNPLTILHLIGGVHNEALMMGLLLLGVVCVFRGLETCTSNRLTWVLLVLGVGLIACAGMVKVTAFVALGFVGMALARKLKQDFTLSPGVAIVSAGLVCGVLLFATIALVTWVTGIPLGWIEGQGGAATVRSWLSASTDIGVAAGFLGQLLGLGNHTEAILTITRGAGVAVAIVFLIRMLIATFRGSIHPIGGLGVSMLVLVVLFPVVHPWYLLWAIFPLAAWANRPFFQYAVISVSAAMSFFVLPRGLGLPPLTVLQIYAGFALGLAAILFTGWVWLQRRGIRVLD
ncbi:MAG: polyprenol phosphomannose-dependent alpha 1,6 mannosyltransferase MptB [Corynebacterium sp.]|nr:polyprenol phosphomannose-dependent alpha 1,6 mannosyltransferase MptB [Corynebacterium sp.]